MKHNILETYGNDCDTLDRPLHIIQKPLRLVDIATLMQAKNPDTTEEDREQPI